MRATQVSVERAPKEKKKANGTNGKPLAESNITMPKEEVVEFAQLVIDERWVRDMKGLEDADSEIHDLVVKMGCQGELAFKGFRSNGNGSNGKGNDMCAEDLRKLEFNGEKIPEETMYKFICAECFRVGTANAVLGSRRNLMVKLTSTVRRKLDGPRYKEFQRAWKAMEREGVIVRGDNDSASLSVQVKSLTDGSLMKDVLTWAIAEQAKVDSSWGSKLGGLVG
jgi:hypothetical protein